MAKDKNPAQGELDAPLFQGLDLKRLHPVETVSEEQAEKYVFETVDFADPNRPKTCLEVDFPILKVNEIAAIENNATKPIYMMSKWWARRRATVFRQLLIAAATKAPADETLAAQTSWSLMYRKHHQRHSKFSHLKVGDIFMGGGTTVVEASRLGFQVTGIDINPIAWWVVNNEINTVAPEKIRAFAEYIETEVKPQIMPFFTAKSPRGFAGEWLDVRTSKKVDVDPASLAPNERKHFRWNGPEVIYTFWMKHIPCADPSCSHITPQVSSSVVAQKSTKLKYWENCVCPSCGEVFDLELGDFRMAPDAKLVLGDNVTAFTFLKQGDSHSACPHCKKKLDAQWISEQGRKKGKPKSKDANHFLLLPKAWLKGISAKSKDQYGGYYGSTKEQDALWLRDRAEGLHLIEVRGEIPEKYKHTNFGTKIKKSEDDEESASGKLVCGKCGREQDPLTSIKLSSHLAPVF